MKYRYLKNLRDNSAHFTADISKIKNRNPSSQTKQSIVIGARTLKQIIYSTLLLRVGLLQKGSVTTTLPIRYMAW